MNHVTICENETVGREYEARAAACDFLRPADATLTTIRTCYLNINNRGTNPLRGLDHRA